MKKFLILFLFSLGLIISSYAKVTVTSKKTSNKEVRNFMNETIAIIKKFVKNTKKFSANISIKEKVIGINNFVNFDCHAEYSAPDFLKMQFNGLYPYSLIVSNSYVYTTFDKTGETDKRILELNENIFEHFLGIGYFKDIKKYNLRFRTEGELYVLKGEMPLRYRIDLQKNILENAYITVFMEIWVNPFTGKVKKSHVISLGGKETYYTYRNILIDNEKKKK